MVVLEKIANIIELVAVLLILWVAVNIALPRYNPHHGLQRAISLMWHGYR